jgi:hypothetical protein
MINYLNIEQNSPEWWAYKVGKISGTRFGQLISGRDNGLIFELANEILDGACEQSDFENDEITFGKENEGIALDLLSQMVSIPFEHGGVMAHPTLSEFCMASPDGVDLATGTVAEIKCTMSGATQMRRFIEGVESKYRPQVANYFFNGAMRVLWASYCPFRPERPLVIHEITPDSVYSESRGKVTTYADVVDSASGLARQALTDVTVLIDSFTQKIEF